VPPLLLLLLLLVAGFLHGLSLRTQRGKSASPPAPPSCEGSFPWTEESSSIASIARRYTLRQSCRVCQPGLIDSWLLPAVDDNPWRTLPRRATSCASTFGTLPAAFSFLQAPSYYLQHAVRDNAAGDPCEGSLRGTRAHSTIRHTFVATVTSR
jgi:hypothetical protein